jgi:Trypsin
MRELYKLTGEPSESRPNSEHDVAVVAVSAVNDEMRRLAADVGGEVVLSVDSTLPDAGVDSLDSRGADDSEFLGGAWMTAVYPNGASICTTGFAWRKNGNPFMTTAGHCLDRKDPYDYPVTAGESMGVGQGTQSTWDDGTGSVKIAGQNSYEGDLSLINVLNSKDVNNRIWDTDSTSIPVVDWYNTAPVEGMVHCTSGQVTGQLCPWEVKDVYIDVTYNDGDVARHVVKSKKQGWCVKKGDSGAPVYYRYDGKAYARGIVSGGGGGGSDGYGGALDPCILTFTDVGDAYDAYEGHLELPAN